MVYKKERRAMRTDFLGRDSRVPNLISVEQRAFPKHSFDATHSTNALHAVESRVISKNPDLNKLQ